MTKVYGTYPHKQRASFPVEPDSEVLRLRPQLFQHGVEESGVRPQAVRKARVVAQLHFVESC